VPPFDIYKSANQPTEQDISRQLALFFALKTSNSLPYRKRRPARILWILTVLKAWTDARMLSAQDHRRTHGTTSPLSGTISKTRRHALLAFFPYFDGTMCRRCHDYSHFLFFFSLHFWKVGQAVNILGSSVADSLPIHQKWIGERLERFQVISISLFLSFIINLWIQETPSKVNVLQLELVRPPEWNRRKNVDGHGFLPHG
jgi:hypothetical protein